jgi:hypothetical protein
MVVAEPVVLVMEAVKEVAVAVEALGVILVMVAQVHLEIVMLLLDLAEVAVVEHQQDVEVDLAQEEVV